MNKDSKWKEYLLKSGIPLEFEIKEFLENNGCTSNFEYTYLREDQANQLLEFSYDIDASYINPPYFVDLMIECKYRHESTKWLFLPEDYNGMDEVNFTNFLHLNNHFNDEKKGGYSEFPFRFADLCSKGIEITTEGQNPKTITQAMSQLSYAMAGKITNGIYHQVDDVLSGNFNGTIFCNIPIIITTAELYRINENASIDNIRNSNEISEIATKTNRLIIKNSIGVDLEKYNLAQFEKFEKQIGTKKLQKKLNSFNDDLDFFWSVMAKHYCPECIVVLHYSKDDNGLDEFLKYLKRYINPDAAMIAEIVKIQKEREERFKKFSEKMKRNGN